MSGKLGGNKSGKINPKPLSEGQKRFDFDRQKTENVSPSHENVAVRIINNPSFAV